VKPVRLGLVGLGKVARDQHIPALALSPGFELLCGATLEGRCPAGATYPSIEAMLEGEPAIEAVALCQPPQARFEAARTALAAGKHVLLEKPPGTTVGELSVLVDMARDRGLSLFAAWHSRFAPAVEPARAWLVNRRVVSVEVVWREDVRVWHPGQRWIWRPGGLGVFDPGINALSIATWILPPLRLIEGELSYPGNQEAPIAAELVMEIAGGGRLTADFDFRQSGPQTWDIHVQTDEGSLMLGKGGARLSIDGEEQPLPPAAEYPSLYGRFAELIARGESDVDSRPLQLTADAFLYSTRRTLEPFEHD
jgi:D-galactose 1-dehydrogenase